MTGPAASIRVATHADLPEILRLAKLLWTDMGLDLPEAGAFWEHSADTFFATYTDDDSLRAYVAVDPGDQTHLVACGLGVITHQMPTSWLPTGNMGYLQWFSTEVEWQRQGLATNILNELMAWFAERDITRVQLHASEAASAIYKRAGFENTYYPNLWHRR